jgi:hypothetical protein
MKLKETNHSYYCSESNYYVGNRCGENYGRCEYNTWEDFKEDWFLNDGSIDCDYNLCFRFDIKQNRDIETDEPTEGFHLWLFFILQRKGIYRPVLIKSVTNSDMIELEVLLKMQWEYMKNQWQEII